MRPFFMLSLALGKDQNKSLLESLVIHIPKQAQ